VLISRRLELPVFFGGLLKSNPPKGYTWTIWSGFRTGFMEYLEQHFLANMALGLSTSVFFDETKIAATFATSNYKKIDFYFKGLGPGFNGCSAGRLNSDFNVRSRNQNKVGRELKAAVIVPESCAGYGKISPMVWIAGTG
jgi:hypothetical protein